jgi:protein-disulfide isomerase
MVKSPKIMIRRMYISLALVLLIAGAAFPQQTQQSSDDIKSLRRELEELKKGQQEMQKDLAEIKNLLLGKQPSAREPKDIAIKLDDGQLLGNKDARVAMIEFSDFQCPYCSRYVRDTWPQIQNEYIKTGKIKYGFRDFPLVSIHPSALKAAVAAQCAGEQGKYWEMHDRLFANSTALGDTDLAKYATELGLETPRFKECVDSGKKEERIKEDLGEGVKAGVGGTPTFFIGTVDSQGAFKVQRVVTGAQPFGNFKQVLDAALASQK